MVEGSDRRRRAAESNYERTENLKKRQALHKNVVAVEGRLIFDTLSELEHETSVIDIGCGNGMWRSHIDGAVTGVDTSMAMLKAARVSSIESLACASITDLPFVDESFDTALMLWMLYHVADHDDALQEVHRVLQPHGMVIATTNERTERGVHAELIAAALSEVVGEPVGTWLEPLSFHSDNAASILGRHFDDVERIGWSLTYQLDDPGPLVDYADSGRDPIEAELGQTLPWSQVLAVLKELAVEHLNEYGNIQFSRSGATFRGRSRRR